MSSDEIESHLRIKRAYEAPSDMDGERYLVDRIWPRGVSKKKAKISQWLQEIAPSTQLRKWFGHRPERWNEFKRRYNTELHKSDGGVYCLIKKAKHRNVTLVYAARDKQHNHAAVLREYLIRKSNQLASKE